MVKKKKRIVFEKKRKTKRFPFRHIVHFGIHRSPEHTSYITDFSDQGVCIKTDRVFQTGTKLHIVIEMGDKSYRAEGVVAWDKRVTPKDVQLVKVDMGVKFTHVEAALKELYHEKFKEILDKQGYFDFS